ncbi:MAG: hypothetical protein FJ395_13080 [Verrucomicrobia bacterium]|nr:hypothetical protein [Verrucomicrobiota bacterium]
MSLFFNETAIGTVDDALRHYGADEFESPTRSTVPLLSWLKHEEQMVAALLRDLGMPADSNLHLEYQVKPPKGTGKASHTDLMAITDGGSLAVEAKWTEPRYKTVSEWLVEGENIQNRRDVLTGWLGLLQRHVQHPLRLEDFTAAVYQMVHRAASASAAGRNPQVAYLVFKPSPDPKTASIEQIQADLEHLRGLLGNPRTLPFHLIEVTLLPTVAFNAIEPLPKKSSATAEKVRSALLASTPLFHFEKYRLVTLENHP